MSSDSLTFNGSELFLLNVPAGWADASTGLKRRAEQDRSAAMCCLGTRKKRARCHMLCPVQNAACMLRLQALLGGGIDRKLQSAAGFWTVQYPWGACNFQNASCSQG